MKSIYYKVVRLKFASIVDPLTFNLTNKIINISFCRRVFIYFSYS